METNDRKRGFLHQKPTCFRWSSNFRTQNENHTFRMVNGGEFKAEAPIIFFDSCTLNQKKKEPIQRWFTPSFVNYKKRCTRLTAASDKVYQLLAHGQWFSPGTPASSTTKTGCHDIAEILLKVALNTKNQSINQTKKDPSMSWRENI